MNCSTLLVVGRLGSILMGCIAPCYGIPFLVEVLAGCQLLICEKGGEEHDELRLTIKRCSEVLGLKPRQRFKTKGPKGHTVPCE